jgi:hypothetical protein
VVVNKTENDNGLLEHLEQIRKSMPILEKWTGIYPTDEMRELVADAYHKVIEFSRAATEYFCLFWSACLLVDILTDILTLHRKILAGSKSSRQNRF